MTNNIFTSLNKTTKLFTIEVENPIFKKLSEFQDGEILQVLGCYKNKKSIYGDSPIFIVQDVHNNIFFVNTPKNHLETIDTITSNGDMVKAINDGQCFIEVVQYFSKRFNKNCFDFQFIEKPKTENQNNVQQPIF